MNDNKTNPHPAKDSNRDGALADEKACLEATLQEVESAIADEVKSYLGWGGLEGPVETFNDLFSGIDPQGVDSETVFNWGWEITRTIVTLCKLNSLNERRDVIIEAMKRSK